MKKIRQDTLGNQTDELDLGIPQNNPVIEKWQGSWALTRCSGVPHRQESNGALHTEQFVIATNLKIVCLGGNTWNFSRHFFHSEWSTGVLLMVWYTEAGIFFLCSVKGQYRAISHPLLVHTLRLENLSFSRPLSKPLPRALFLSLLLTQFKHSS